VSSRAGGPVASGATLALNTVWNLAGMILPALAALVAIPVLIGRLGEARFGILTLAWVLSILFTLSDLGLSRATTNLLARGWEEESRLHLARVFWASLAVLVLLGTMAGALFAGLTPWLVDTILRTPVELRGEAVRGFLLLAASAPVVLAGGPFRSLLESTQSFGRLNAVRIPISLLNYLGPLVLSFVTPRLDFAIGVIAATRVAGFVGFAVQAYRVTPDLLVPARPSGAVARELLRVGAWFGVTGITLPAVAALDRLIIGARLSLADVGHYAAPYEVVTRLWFLSGSLLIVMFPVFSALRDTGELRLAYWRAVRYLFLPTALAASLLVTFSPELFTMWLGAEFGAASAPVAQWLALGVLASVVGQVPFTFLMTTGRRAVAGVVHLVEVPLYAAAAWLLAGHLGIVGVAAAWAARAVAEAAVLFVCAAAVTPAARSDGQRGLVLRMISTGAALLVSACLVGFFASGQALLKFAFMLAIVSVFLGWSWRALLEPSERAGLHSMPGDLLRSIGARRTVQ